MDFRFRLRSSSYGGQAARNDEAVGPHSRGTKCPGDASILRLEKQRARGMPGAGAPAAACACSKHRR